MREIIAILRGITPPEAPAITEALISAGIAVIEVPLNSPDPFDSIAQMVKTAGDRAAIGAGTVLDPADVAKLKDLGARLVVSPDCNPAVIEATKDAAMASYPGVLTPSECFTALRHGADGLKFFPASNLGLDGFKAYKAVLPPEVRTYAVGGVGPNDFADWKAAGITGFGVGSALYKPGMSPEDAYTNATKLTAAYDAAA